MNSRIWQHCVIGETVKIGERCNICSHVFIEDGVTVGNDVVIKNGAKIYGPCEIKDRVFIGPNAVICNDKYPRAGVEPNRRLTVVNEGASIGAGAVVMPGVEIGANAMVGANCVVTGEVPPSSLSVGVPMQIYGQYSGAMPTAKRRHETTEKTKIEPARVIENKFFADDRGSISVSDLPFAVRRSVLMFPIHGTRGGHAHRKCHQVLIGCRGRVVYHVCGPAELHGTLFTGDALYIPPMNWITLSQDEVDSMAMLLCSDPYDPTDYIRYFDEFVSMLRSDYFKDTGTML